MRETDRQLQADKAFVLVLPFISGVTLSKYHFKHLFSLILSFQILKIRTYIGVAEKKTLRQ